MAKALQVIKVVLGSFSLCLLLSFVTLEVFLEYCPSKDLQFLGPNQLKDRPPVLAKLERYEREHPHRPTVLLVGSSLAQYGSALCDFGIYGSPDLNKEFAGYSRFRYFDQLLAKAHQPLFETANLSNSGTMLSEDFLIIKEVFRKKNPPKAVVLEIGPRDFIDNMTPEPYRSRLAQVLSRRQEPFSWRSDRTVTENLDMTAEKLSLFYSMKGELHDCLIKIVCDQTHHPASIYQASLMAKLAPKPELLAAGKDSATGSTPTPTPTSTSSATTTTTITITTTNATTSATAVAGAFPSKGTAAGGQVGGKGQLRFGHVDDEAGTEGLIAFSEGEYHGRYLPLNKKKWPVELANLKSIVAFCRSKNVPLVVVNMPLTERNLKILPADFRAVYEKTVADVCSPTAKGSNIAYVNLRHDQQFQLQDFRDTAHMRSTGGKKLADLLAPVVVSKIEEAADKDADKGNTRVAAKSKPGSHSY